MLVLCITPATLRDAAARGWVRSLGADVAVAVAYGRIVPPALLDAPAHGWINLHFSLLAEHLVVAQVVARSIRVTHPI